ncbi:MAG TPA: DUF922 domain-containing protein [Allosphingosinicella sp.]
MKVSQGQPCLALASLSLLTAAPAAAQPVPAPTPVVAAPAPSPMAQVPGIVVRYYDVSGQTIEALGASVEAQRPKDPVTGQLVPAAKWSIGTSLRKETKGSACRIIGATATFKAEVLRPRLASADGVPPPVLAAWQAYLASLEAQQVAALRPVYERLSEVEKAALASTCEGAAAAASRAIAEISKAPAPAPAPAPAAPTPAG